MIEGPVHTSFTIRPEGGPLRFHLVCMTMLLCSYRIDVRNPDGTCAAPFPVSGNNLASKEVMVRLPEPVRENAGRRIWCSVALVDQTGEGGDYTLVAELLQDTDCLGSMTTGKRRLEEETVEVVLTADIAAVRRIR
jgi:hypothetical protein